MAAGLGPTRHGYERTLDGGWLAMGGVAGIGPARSRDLVEGTPVGRGETVAEGSLASHRSGLIRPPGKLSF